MCCIQRQQDFIRRSTLARESMRDLAVPPTLEERINDGGCLGKINLADNTQSHYSRYLIFVKHTFERA
jgi:hypothetical protein